MLEVWLHFEKFDFNFDFKSDSKFKKFSFNLQKSSFNFKKSNLKKKSQLANSDFEED